MSAQNRDIAAFFFGLGMGMLADPQSQSAATVGVILSVLGMLLIVNSRTSGAGQ